MRERKYKPRQYVDYYRYIASPEWEARKAEYKRKAFKRPGSKCKLCSGNKVALSIHHKTYARLGDELHSDLMAVCDPCHKLIHALQKVGDDPKNRLPGKIKKARQAWWSKASSENLWYLRWKDPAMFAALANNFFLSRFNLDENYKRIKQPKPALTP